MSKNNVVAEIAIIGTGLSGLICAAALAQAELPVTLLGPVPDAYDTRTTAILTPGIDLLKSLGVWTQCAPQATPLMTMELIDGARQFVFDAAEIDRNEFGFNIANAPLKRALMALLQRNKAVTWHDDIVTEITEKNAWQLQGKKKTYQARLLIGADGRTSGVRKAACIAIRQKEEDQSALVAVLEAEKPHHYTSVEWYSSGGPVTLVPMPEKQLALVWCDTRDRTAERIKRDPDLFNTELTALTEGRFGKLTLKGKRQSWPVQPMRAERMIGKSVALIGEAAHVLAPIGAQGFNTSIADTLALRDALSAAKKLGLPYNDATLLQGYAQARQNDIAMRFHGINGLNDMIRSSFLPIQILRTAGLKTLTKITPLKRLLMRAGMTSFNRTAS